MPFSKIKILKLLLKRNIILILILFFISILSLGFFAFKQAKLYCISTILQYKPYPVQLGASKENLENYLKNKIYKMISDKDFLMLIKKNELKLSPEEQSQLINDFKNKINVTVLEKSINNNLQSLDFELSYYDFEAGKAELFLSNLKNFLIKKSFVEGQSSTELKALLLDLQATQKNLESVFEIIKLQNAGHLPEHAILNAAVLEKVNQEQKVLASFFQSELKKWKQQSKELITKDNSYIYLDKTSANIYNRALPLVAILALSPSISNGYEKDFAKETTWGLWQENIWILVDILAQKDELKEKNDEYQDLSKRSKIVEDINHYLLRDLEKNKHELLWVEKKLTENTGQQALSDNQVIISAADKSLLKVEKIETNIFYWLILGAILGLVLAFFAVLGRELNSKKIIFPKTASALSAWPIVGILPFLKSGSEHRNEKKIK